MIDIKACPFCGEPPHKRRNQARGGLTIQCRSPLCTALPGIDGEETQAIAAWNARYTDPAVDLSALKRWHAASINAVERAGIEAVIRMTGGEVEG